MKPETYSLMRELEDEHWWFVARRRIIASLLGSLELPPQCNILEVGCGTGGNLAMLGGFGEVIAVETDESAARMASERNLSTVHQGGLPGELPGFSEDFDLICLFDVLEHVGDDAASLQTLKQLLKPRGRIVLTVPAFPFLWSQHDEENQHFRRYRLRDLKRMVAAGGLNLDYASYFNFWLFPPVAAVRLIRKVLPYEESWKDMRLPGPTVNTLLRATFASERHVIGKLRFPFGISLIAVISN